MNILGSYHLILSSEFLNIFKSAIKVCKKESCNRGCGKSPTCETNCGKCHCKCCDCCDDCCCASPCCRSQSCGDRVCAICCQALCGCIAKFFSILFCYFLCSDDQKTPKIKDWSEFIFNLQIFRFYNRRKQFVKFIKRHRLKNLQLRHLRDLKFWSDSKRIFTGWYFHGRMR